MDYTAYVAVAVVLFAVGFLARWLWTHPPFLRCGKFREVNDAGYCSPCGIIRRFYKSTYTDRYPK